MLLCGLFFSDTADVPRALKAVDVENPIGTPDHDPKGLSVLQQHVAFFDRNDDGIIYPWETFQGTRSTRIFIIILVSHPHESCVHNSRIWSRYNKN
jgi:hypothetical protein